MFQTGTLISAFYFKAVDQNSVEEHRRAVIRKYRKWQEEHPITRETLSLLMTGRESNEDDENAEDEKVSQKKDCDDHESGSCRQQASAKEEQSTGKLKINRNY